MESSGAERINACKIIIPVCVLISGVVCLSSTVTSIMIYKGELPEVWKDTSVGIMCLSSIIFLVFCIFFIRQVMSTCYRTPSEEQPEHVLGQYLRRILGFRVGDFQISDTESPMVHAPNGSPNATNDGAQTVLGTGENPTSTEYGLHDARNTNDECAEAPRTKEIYTKTE